VRDNEKNAAVSAVQGTAAIIDGDYLGAAAHFIRGALELASESTVRQLVNEETIKRANAIADAIEGERFGK
jgi:hypothetical protein